MILPLLYFISSLLITIATMRSFSRLSRTKYFLLVVASVIYAAFCFVAYGKMAGLIPTVTMEQTIVQQGFDVHSLPLPLTTLLDVAFCGAILFNLSTAIWIWMRGGLWKWFLTFATGFCIVCACAGLSFGIFPLYSLFGGCCAFMASVAWVLGLTYVEFCVIGNIWIPCAAIIGTASFFVYGSWRYIRSRSGMAAVWSLGSIIFAFLQIIAAILLLYHYQGTMTEAFRRCVDDLNLLVRYTHTSYEMVNIFIWVFMGATLLTFNIAVGRHLIKQNDNQSVKQDNNQPVKQPLNKKIWLAIIAIILVLVAGGWLLLVGQQDK